MENIKPEDILRNHKNGSDVNLTNYISEDGFVWKSIVNRMREYAQIACSTLSEEIREKDDRISELESALKKIEKYGLLGISIIEIKKLLNQQNQIT